MRFGVNTIKRYIVNATIKRYIVFLKINSNGKTFHRQRNWQDDATASCGDQTVEAGE
jgi:hypothetical protein